jgi:hypothetical protein
MKKITLIAMFFGVILLSNGQVDTTKMLKKDTIVFKGNLWSGEKYSYQGKENLRFRDVKELLNFDEENQRIISNAETAKTFSTIFGFAGGFCVGYALGSSFGGKPINLPLLGAGAGLILVSIPISSGYVKNVKKAVNNFNRKQ